MDDLTRSDRGESVSDTAIGAAIGRPSAFAVGTVGGVAHGALALLATLLILRTLWFIYNMTRPMPYWDAWEFMKALPGIFEHRYSLHDLFAFHNEHRIVTTRLVMLADTVFFDATGYLSTALVVLLLCTMGVVLAVVTAGWEWQGLCPAAVTVSLLLSVAQSDNYSSGFQVQFPLTDLCAIAGIGFFVLSNGVSRLGWLWLVAAVVADALAIGSMASGNIVVGPVIAVAVALRTRMGHVVVFVLSAAAMSAAYLIGYPKPDAAPSRDIIGIAHFVVNYIGASLRGYSGASLFLGTTLLGCYAAILAGMVRSWWRLERLDPVQVWLAAVMGFVLCGGLLTATGRLNLGIDASISSRYAIQSLLFACCLFLITWRLAEAHTGATELRLCLISVFLILSAASTLASQPLAEWRARVADYDTAGSSFASGVYADTVITGVYPLPHLIRATISFMAAHRLGPFSTRYATIFRPPLNAMQGLDTTTMPGCRAVEDRSFAVGPKWLEVDGWAVAPNHPAGGGWLFAFDASRRLLGFTRQVDERPDVARALDIGPSQLGYRLSLNVSGIDPATRDTMQLVLLPDGHEGSPCSIRAALMHAQ